MYNWDSYFINKGLLLDGKIQLAKEMVENHVYQVEHYGWVLNANRYKCIGYLTTSRTYFLFRSQPPFLSCMVLEYFNATKNVEWLKAQLPALEKYHEFFTTGKHVIALEHGDLSRFYGFGKGPAPEVLSSERDEHGKSHFDRVKEFYKEKLGTNFDFGYDVSLYYDETKDELKDLFYIGDRAMRESGYDPSCRFGYFNVDVIHYVPVCLNALLFRYEMDLYTIYHTVGNASKAEQWKERAEKRKKTVDHYLWDETHQTYFDYNFLTKQRRAYNFATMIMPLWAGMASKEQASKVIERVLSKLEKQGGISTSDQTTGCQWDDPFGWAPLQLMVVEALKAYGHEQDAIRIARKFVNLIVEDFGIHKTLFEKYNVETGGSAIVEMNYGYLENVIGFGWTNGVFLELLKHIK